MADLTIPKHPRHRQQLGAHKPKGRTGKPGKHAHRGIKPGQDGVTTLEGTNDVRELQKGLASLGYDLKSDGDFRKISLGATNDFIEKMEDGPAKDQVKAAMVQVAAYLEKTGGKKSASHFLYKLLKDPEVAKAIQATAAKILAEKTPQQAPAQPPAAGFGEQPSPTPVVPVQPLEDARPPAAQESGRTATGRRIIEGGVSNAPTAQEPAAQESGRTATGRRIIEGGVSNAPAAQEPATQEPGRTATGRRIIEGGVSNAPAETAVEPASTEQAPAATGRRRILRGGRVAPPEQTPAEQQVPPEQAPAAQEPGRTSSGRPILQGGVSNAPAETPAEPASAAQDPNRTASGRPIVRGGVSDAPAAQEPAVQQQGATGGARTEPFLVPTPNSEIRYGDVQNVQPGKAPPAVIVREGPEAGGGSAAPAGQERTHTDSGRPIIKFDQ